MKKTCEICMRRDTCNKLIGIQFGFCNTDYTPNYEIEEEDDQDEANR